MKTLLAIAIVAGSMSARPALAQADMTCESFVQIEGANNKSKPNTSGDPPEDQEMTKKILEYCTANPTASVEDASKAVSK